MTGNHTPFTIRPSRLADEDALIEICHLTGDTRIDPYLLALRYCLDYLWHEPHNCFTAANSLTGKVAGYIVGTVNTRQQEVRFDKVMLPMINTHWLTITPKTLTQWHGYLMMRVSIRNPFRGMISEYPAHLHINVHPDSQRAGLGSKLIATYEKNLVQQGIKGYHLGVTGDNQVGISFYQKRGLTRLGQFPPIGNPWVVFFGRKLGTSQ